MNKRRIIFGKSILPCCAHDLSLYYPPTNAGAEANHCLSLKVAGLVDLASARFCQLLKTYKRSESHEFIKRN